MEIMSWSSTYWYNVQAEIHFTRIEPRPHENDQLFNSTIL